MLVRLWAMIGMLLVTGVVLDRMLVDRVADLVEQRDVVKIDGLKAAVEDAYRAGELRVDEQARRAADDAGLQKTLAVMREKAKADVFELHQGEAKPWARSVLEGRAGGPKLDLDGLALMRNDGFIVSAHPDPDRQGQSNADWVDEAGRAGGRVTAETTKFKKRAVVRFVRWIDAGEGLWLRAEGRLDLTKLFGGDVFKSVGVRVYDAGGERVYENDEDLWERTGGRSVRIPVLSATREPVLEVELAAPNLSNPRIARQVRETFWLAWVPCMLTMIVAGGVLGFYRKYERT